MENPNLLKLIFPAVCLGLLSGCNSSPTPPPIRCVAVEANESPANTGAIGVNLFGRERTIDMAQFERVELDIPYADGANERQRLDIAYPRSGRAPFKFIVVFHGGGWLTGQKQSEAIAPIFQATTQGYAVVSVNYRLDQAGRWPLNLHDAKAAIRFIRAHAARYDLDATNIVVWGNTAGGYLAQMLAATNERLEFEDLGMGTVGTSSSVQGVVSWCGVADVSALAGTNAGGIPRIMGRARSDYAPGGAIGNTANPIDHVRSVFPPILLVHGTHDKVVPYEQSVRMKARINRMTGRETAILKTFEGATHGDPVIKANANVADNLHFVDRILYPDGINPYRSSHYIDIRLKEPEAALR